MKTAILFIALIFSSQLQAACKCNCDIKSLTLCASSYDLDYPCDGACPADGPSTFAPPRTACPMVEVFDELRGAHVWHSLCHE